jgi:hypothetical protein
LSPVTWNKKWRTKKEKMRCIRPQLRTSFDEMDSPPLVVNKSGTNNSVTNNNNQNGVTKTKQLNNLIELHSSSIIDSPRHGKPETILNGQEALDTSDSVVIKREGFLRRFFSKLKHNSYSPNKKKKKNGNDMTTTINETSKTASSRVMNKDSENPDELSDEFDEESVNFEQQTKDEQEIARKYKRAVERLLKLVTTKNPTSKYRDLTTVFISNTHHSQILKGTDPITGKMVCLKMAPLSEREKLIEIDNEIQLMQLCNHPNIIGYYGVSVYKKCVWISMEYCARGTLTDMLLLNGFRLTEEQIASICRELLNGLLYLHEEMLIIHRDLKSDNILITENYEIKISDMGLSVKCTDKNERFSACVGTPFWVAPEMIQFDETYSFKVDIWSLGIVLWEMINNAEPPYFEMDPQEAMQRIAFKPAPRLTGDQWSPSFKDFMSKILCKMPEQRLSARQALQHEFIVEKAMQKPSEFLPSIISRLSSQTSIV